jgi:lipopolysaccharide heptosyltransferase I
MHIAIVKLSSIGDVVHALPAAALLRRALPEARITWIVERRASAILQDSPAIDELIEIDSRAWRKQALSTATRNDVRQTFARIRQAHSDARVDIAIDFQGLLKSGLVTRATGAQHRIGFEAGELREPASRFFLTEQVKTADHPHVIDKNLALAHAALARVGIAGEQIAKLTACAYEFPIAVAPQDERYVEAAIQKCNRRFAILNPGGGWTTKLWPAARFGELADRLRREYELVSLITYGPGEEGLAETVAQASQTGAAEPIASTLKQFIALARRAALFVGGDTGPLHLAAASGTPIVGLYGPTLPERNGPFDRRDVIIGRDLWCRAACHRRRCWHWECMDISVSVVAQAARLRLARAESNQATCDNHSAMISVAPLPIDNAPVNSSKSKTHG